MLIETEGLGEEKVTIDMKQTYKQGREQNRLNIGLNDTAEWIYKKTTREVRPTLTRQTEEATQTTWETRQASKNAGRETLEEMGFNGRAESSSRGECIRKREQYQKDNETYKYPREKVSKNPKTQHVSNKQNRRELKEKLEGQIQEWSRGEIEKDEITTNAEKVLSKGGEATTELIRKVIRDGMNTERASTTEEIYKYNEYIILDASWGQYTEGSTDQTKTILRVREAYSGFQRIVKNYEKVIAIIHYGHHWSFTVINTIEGIIQI